MKLRNAYQTRSIRFCEVAEHTGWQIKVYCITRRSGITRRSDAVETNKVLEHAKKAVFEHLPETAVSEM